MLKVLLSPNITGTTFYLQRGRCLMLLMMLLAACCMPVQLSAQTRYKEVTFDEENGLPHAHITQLLQDGQGFIWFATWNGLCRYDGYEFHTFKPAVGDGCNMTTDRYRDISLMPDGKILCRVDDDYFYFDTRSCTFRNLTEQEKKTAPEDIKRYRKSISNPEEGRIFFSITDKQGNEWFTTRSGVTCRTAIAENSWRLDITPKAQVKCLFADRQGRYWVTTREDCAVRLYSAADNRLLGYLGADGKLHATHTSFSAPVYSMYQDRSGALWLCTKPKGLYRLREAAGPTFQVEMIEGVYPSVYNAVQDKWGRLWVATLGGGLLCCDKPQAEKPLFRVPKGYPKDKASRLRYLLMTRDGRTLLAAGTERMVVATLDADMDKMQFRLHQRESNRAESLSSSATMDMLEDTMGRIYISTESGGVNVLEASELLSEHPHFGHISTATQHLTNDVVMALTSMSDRELMVVGGHIITILPFKALIPQTSTQPQPDSSLFTLHSSLYTGSRLLDSRFFGDMHLRFSDAHPLHLPGGRWLIGLTDGAVFTADSLIMRHGYCPPLLITGVTVQGSDNLWNVTYADSLTLHPHQRNVTIHFAALDYTASEHINYAFRMDEDGEWNKLGNNHTLTLLDLEPGTYVLQLRSTNANGEWQENVRSITLEVIPTFWESVWGKLLIALLIVLALTAIVATAIYIRRIKRKQRETLQAYLSMLDENDKPNLGDNERPQDSPDNPEQPKQQKSQFSPKSPVESASSADPMLDRILQFIEQNIGNSNATVGDMAQAAATSRSGLQRKLKHAMGITPQDLLREARIKHACRLLHSSAKSVAEVAYSCGFTDPKYFSRCFKQSTGYSPTDYRNVQ